MIARIKQWVDTMLERTLIVLMATMVLNVLWQVFTRFVIQSPSAFTDELARFGLIWIGIIGSAYATGQKMHLAIDYFTQNISGLRRKVSTIFIESVVLLFALSAFVIGGSRLVIITLALGQTSAALQVKLAYVYMVIPVSGLIIVLYAAINIWTELTAGSPLSGADELTTDGGPSAGLEGVE